MFDADRFRQIAGHHEHDPTDDCDVCWLVELVRWQQRCAGERPAVVLGRAGGKKGGPERARRMTPERRSEISRKAAEARWGERRKR